MIGLTIPARASGLTWNWSWSNDPSNIGSGTLTTNAISNGSYLVTAMSGTFDSNPITGLLPVGQFNTTPSNDNLLFAGSAELDYGGLAFTTGGNQFNLFHLGGSAYGQTKEKRLPTYGTFSATMTSASEPGTLALLAAGLGALGFAVSRRKLRTDASSISSGQQEDSKRPGHPGVFVSGPLASQRTFT